MTTPTLSLEKQLETAYATVAKANEADLATITPTLSTLILAQAPQPNDDGSDPGTQLEVPYVLLTGKQGNVSLRDFRGQPVVFEGDLTIEAADNAADASASGGALDARYLAAINPLRYKAITNDATPPVTRTLCQALSDAATSLQFLALIRCGDSQMEPQGSVVRRWVTATFLCQLLPS